MQNDLMVIDREALNERAEAQRRTEGEADTLAETVRQLTYWVARLDQRTLEQDYRTKAAAYFGRWLRRPQVLTMDNVWEALESRLTAAEFDDVLLIDLLVRGRPLHQLQTAGRSDP